MTDINNLQPLDMIRTVTNNSTTRCWLDGRAILDGKMVKIFITANEISTCFEAAAFSATIEVDIDGNRFLVKLQY